jgi:hypothetical protein
MGPFEPLAPQWMCPWLMLWMLAAINRKSTVLPSPLTRKIPCPYARESAGVGASGIAGAKTSWLPRRWGARL